MEIIKSPWQNTFINLLKEARRKVYLASPFIKKQTANLIVDNARSGLDIRYINSFKLNNFYRGASDLDALRAFDDFRVKQKNAHNLHAKFFIFDDKAIITSGNLTPGGLRNNIEYGILIKDKLVDEITEDFIEIFDNDDHSIITSKIIQNAEDILMAVPEENRKRLKFNDSALFEDIVNDEQGEEKFDGGIESILSNLTPWKRNVFECLLKIKGDIFSIDEVYSFEGQLRKIYPHNHNIQPKIRQQLQFLRDIGLVEFIRPGLYKKLWG